VKIASGRVVLQGNMDPGVLYGGKKAITADVEQMVRGFGGGKQGWIANLGHGKKVHANNAWTLKLTYRLGVQPGVKPDDLEFFFQEVHRLAGSGANL